MIIVLEVVIKMTKVMIFAIALMKHAQFAQMSRPKKVNALNVIIKILIIKKHMMIPIHFIVIKI